MSNKCLICLRDKIKFETAGISFSDHKHHKHNFWNYLDFLITLKQSQITEFNSDEFYIYEMMKEKKLNWVPVSQTRYLSKTKIIFRRER